jgi:hypothetical protein
VSAWDDTRWRAFCGLLDEGWPGDFDDAAQASWRVLLDQVDPQQATVGLRRLLLEGRRFRPSVSELLAACRSDAGQPTWDEAWRLICTALSAPGYAEARRRHAAATGSTFLADDTDRELRDNGRQAALANAHERVRRFVAVMGWPRLAAALDTEWGEARLHALKDAWAEQAHAIDGRELAALASGRPDGLHQFDPLSALDVGRKELEA